MPGRFDWQDLVALVRILQSLPIRLTCLVLAAPLAWVGRAILPRDVPVAGLSALIAGDLGPVAAGVFLSLAGIALALGYGLGTLGMVASRWQALRPPQSAGWLLSVIVLVAVVLYLCGRAFSWVGALWMMAAAGGLIWGGNFLWHRYSPPPTDATVYDPWRDN